MTARTTESGQQKLDQIAANFSSWHIWRSEAGRWYGTRLGDIRPRRDRDAGWAMTVDGEDADELCEKLAIQARLDGLLPRLTR